MKKLIFLFFSLLLLAGCTGESYQTISTEKAIEMIDGKQVSIIDVRSPEEFAAGHIPAAKLVPLETLEEMKSELDKNSAYIIVCRSGNRSAKASTMLADNGFKQIFNLGEGMNGWTGDIER
jgi:rhodanese-related sulfurtransferase